MKMWGQGGGKDGLLDELCTKKWLISWRESEILTLYTKVNSRCIKYFIIKNVTTNSSKIIHGVFFLYIILEWGRDL